MKKNLCSFLIVFAVLSSVSAYGQWRIQTKSGAQYIGTIVDEKNGTLILKSTEDSSIQIPRDEITLQERVSLSDLKKINQKTSYPLLGLTLGTPAGLHVVLGYDFGAIGMRATAGYLGDLYGGEFNLFHSFSNNSEISPKAGISAGYSHIPVPVRYYDDFGYTYTQTDLKTWTYIALEFDINWHGLFGMAGLSFGSGSFSNPQLMLQGGYVYEFK